MLRRLLKNRVGTAEIVGTVLFLVILFFFFSNVFLWHNKVSREMDQLNADKTNSAVRIEAQVLPGNPVISSGGQNVSEEGSPEYSLKGNYTFVTSIRTTEEKRLVADLRFSVNASFVDDLNEPCFVYILDCDQNAWINTELMVMNGYRWSNTTLSLPSSYVDEGGKVTVKIVDSSSQLGINDIVQGQLNIAYMAIYADRVALKVVNVGGTDATLSRLWIINATDHLYADFDAVPNGTLVAGGSRRTIVLSTETTFTDGEGSILATTDGDNIVVHYVPPAGQTVTFKVLTTLGNTAAYSYTFT
jgi:hypothetical protein